MTGAWATVDTTDKPFYCSKGKHCYGCAMDSLGDPICQAKHYRFDTDDDDDDDSLEDDVDLNDEVESWLTDWKRDEALLRSLDK